NIEFRESDLFSNITEQFDLIIFNPPYLPNEPKAPDIALDGGPKGYELIEQFLKSAKYNLKTKGVILLLFSSFTNQKKVNKILTTNNYFFRQIDKTHINFEDLFVYEIKKQN
ncbi:MAG: methyltransferase, partial [Nanoarchaeota archaeon]|nr:methyltransferase [Nanoarchaeota archaeon]